MTQKIFYNKKAITVLAGIAIIAGIIIAGFTTTYAIGGFVTASQDPDFTGAFKWDWIVPGQKADDDDLDTSLYAHEALNLRFSIYHTLDENAQLSAGVTVYITDHDGVTHSYSTDANGQVTTTGNHYNSYTDVDVYVGEVDNSTWAQQKFSFTIPGYGDSADDKPNPMDISKKLLYLRVATAAQVTAKVLDGASDITASGYNITASGETATLTFMWTLSTAERFLGDCYDRLEDGGEIEEYWLFISFSSSSNTAPGSIDVSISGAQEAMFGTSALLIGKRLSNWYYDLDAEDNPITGRGPSHTITATIGWGDTGYTSNRTEFTMDVYLCIGTPWSYFVSTSSYEANEIFIDNDISSFSIES